MKNKLADSIKEMERFKRRDSQDTQTHDSSGNFKITTLSAFSDFSMNSGILLLKLIYQIAYF